MALLSPDVAVEWVAYFLPHMAFGQRADLSEDVVRRRLMLLERAHAQLDSKMRDCFVAIQSHMKGI